MTEQCTCDNDVRRRNIVAHQPLHAVQICLNESGVADAIVSSIAPGICY